MFCLFNRLQRHRHTLSKMASKRSTNNSVVAYLEDQSKVIEDTLAVGGVASGKSHNSSGDKVKSIPKNKSGKGKQTTSGQNSSATGKGDVRITLVTPAAANGMTQGAGRSQALTPGQATEPSDVPSDPGDLPGNGGTGSGPGSGPTHPRAATGDAGSASFVDGEGQDVGVLDAHQRWLWQQQQQMQQQMQAFPMHFGNFVPNFALGGSVPLPVFLEDGEAEVDEEVVDGAPRQPTHAMSNDEGEEPIPPGAAGAAGPIETGLPEDGQLASLIKEQLGQVKGCDKVLTRLAPAVAQLLDRYLKEAHYVSEMEKLAKQYPRIENVEWMKVPRLDDEVFQAIDQRFRNVDQGFQSIQWAVMSAMAALGPVFLLVGSSGGKDPELDEISRRNQKEGGTEAPPRYGLCEGDV